MELPIRFSRTSYYLVAFGYRHSPQHPVHKTPSECALILMRKITANLYVLVSKGRQKCYELKGSKHYPNII
jgi:hypothetical protein